ncbi:MAG: hypothetical protein Q7V63_02255 [Gammaproteobacteria bacterium]|nr:hypothetical protein [Gammaproteobacteria bacterium]
MREGGNDIITVSRDLAIDVIKYMLSEGESQDVAGILEVIKQQTEYRSEAVTIAEQIEQWGVQKGMRQGMLQGMQQGEYEKACAIAKNLLAKGISYAVVKEATGLSDEEMEGFKPAH